MISMELGWAGDGGTRHKAEKKGRRAHTCSGSTPSTQHLKALYNPEELTDVTHLKFNFDTNPLAETVISSSSIYTVEFGIKRGVSKCTFSSSDGAHEYSVTTLTKTLFLQCCCPGCQLHRLFESIALLYVRYKRTSLL